MGLFTDLFSTKPAEDAAAAKKAGLAQGYDALAGQYQQGRDVLGNNIAQGQGALTDALSRGRDALTGEINQGNAAITSGYGAGRDALTSGFSDASALYKPLLDSTAAGANTYGDATGVNGQAGIDRAGSTFKSLPGYSGGLTTGIDAANRGAAARGGLAGGNATADVIKFASDYDANKYGSFVNNLAPYVAANSNAVSGAAGLAAGQGTALNSSLAGQGNALSSNFGTLGTGINANYGTLGTGVNADYGALGGGLNSSYMSQGGAANANLTGQGQAQADADMAAYTASQNFWGALTGGANMALKASGVGGYGMPTGGGGGGGVVLGGAGGPGQFKAA